jgi:hypothetical protein
VTKKTTFNGYAIAVASDEHPLQSRLQFIFTDFLPNKNKQGVRREEAANIINSAMYMPVKVHFDGDEYYGHSGAFPIGPIIEMREEGDVLVAEALVWKDEFPDLVEHLHKKVAADAKRVNFSWEMYYTGSDFDEDGNEWLNGCVVAGTTIVDRPAYVGRTHLIAMAEHKDIDGLVQQVDDLGNLIQSILAELKDMRSDSMDESQTDLQAAESDVVVAEGEAADPAGASDQGDTDELASMRDELAALRSEVEELRSFRQQVESDRAKAEILSARRQSLADAGIAMTDEAFAEKSDLFVAMDDSQFTDWVDFTVSLIKTHAKSASAETRSGNGLIPDPIVGGADRPSISKLAKELRKSRVAG